MTVGSRWFVVGLGRVGRTVARALDRAGHLAGAWTRSKATAASAGADLSVEPSSGALPDLSAVDVVVIAVPDDRIGAVARALRAQVDGSGPAVWLHTSGAHDASVLGATQTGVHLGSVHPLRSMTGGPEDDARLSGAFFALEGDDEAAEAGRRLVALFGGVPERVPSESKAAYHAAAVVASNGVYALLHLAESLCERAGLRSPELRSGLGRLAVGSAENAVALGVDAAATGPVVRGDAGTVRAHIDWLAASAPEELALYTALSDHLLQVAERSGRAPEHALHAVATVLAAAAGTVEPEG